MFESSHMKLRPLFAYVYRRTVPVVGDRLSVERKTVALPGAQPQVTVTARPLTSKLQRWLADG